VVTGGSDRKIACERFHHGCLRKEPTECDVLCCQLSGIGTHRRESFSKYYLSVGSVNPAITDGPCRI